MAIEQNGPGEAIIASSVPGGLLESVPTMDATQTTPNHISENVPGNITYRSHAQLQGVEPRPSEPYVAPEDRQQQGPRRDTTNEPLTPSASGTIPEAAPEEVQDDDTNPGASARSAFLHLPCHHKWTRTTKVSYGEFVLSPFCLLCFYCGLRKPPLT